MREGDYEAVAELCGQLCYPTSAHEVRQRLEAMGPEHAAFVASNAQGKVVGWIHVFIRRTIELDAFAEIGGLVVSAAERREGHGTDLMGQAEEWARSRGLSQVWLRSMSIRIDAHRFYERVGYGQGKTSLTFRRNLEDGEATG